MRDFKSITFIGLGLIGGSMAKKIKLLDPNIRIIAHASLPTIEKAYKDGVIANSTQLEMEELGASDLIILCCPVDTNITYFSKLKPHLTNNAIITDVGSVKGDIHHAARSHGISDKFVGGHPMAGSEKSGYKYATENLLENCIYVLTTDDGVENQNEIKLFNFAKELGTNPKLMSFSEHDKTAAAISHLPHVLASVLSNYVKKNDHTGFMHELAATGFRDTTRIAAGSPEVWQQICMANYESLLDMIRGYQRELRLLEDIIENNELSALYEYLSNAKDFRETF